MKSYRILYLLILLIFVSCSENKEARELFAKVESVMEEHPDSALAMLDSAHINRTRLSNDIEGKYALLYTMAQDKNGLDVDDDSLIRIAYNYYKDKTEDSLYAKGQYYMGKYLSFNDSTYAAEMCFNHAIDKGKALKDYKTAYMACNRLSRSLALSDIKHSISIAKEGLRLQEKYDSDDTINHVYMLVNIGNKYLYSSSDKGNALPYLLQAKMQAGGSKDTTLLSFVMQNLSTAHMSLCNTDSALYYAELASNLSNDESIQLLHAITLYNADSIQRSKQILNMIIEKSSSPNVLYSCYWYLNKISSKANDIKASTENFDSAHVKMNRMYEKAMQLRNDYYVSTLQKEKENTALAEKSKMKGIYIIIAISVGLLAIFLISLLYIFSKKESKRKIQLEEQRHKLLLQHQEEENRRERELEELKHKLDMEAAEKRHQDEIAIREQQLDIMRDSLLSKLAFMKKIAKTKDDNKAINLTDEDWKEIETFLNGVDNLFVERIKKEYPNLKEKDLQFCMLLRLKCSTQDLMNIYCINEQSVKQKKYKFKAKLGITDAQISAKQFIVEY